MFSEQTLLTRVIWIALGLIMLDALIQREWSLAFIALATLALSFAPILVARWAEIDVPPSFLTAIVIFVGATLFMGEVLDFYNRFWWWDIAMHGGSAIGFGLIGFVAVFMMFQGDRYAAPHWAIAFFAFAFALSIGTLWEIFEFAMDQTFGTNMQKSGLMDTITDLIVNTIGAALGAASGFAYLKGRAYGGLTGVIDEFIRRNPRLFRRLRRK
ncbi:hypothetical protein SAMN05443999_10968 [Roseovarius azorensis]|uniref:Membrane protein YjdF n=1 Tax=Roseovarius azorensis TaxID=1287727 RepID=A0A1H7TX68_9RHOB|nr:hypothetical protein [Roseovarius azorensis]SEL89058.1 hypothetical protein SAMN05443999_10968 [Roseovarius azorensis]